MTLARASPALPPFFIFKVCVCHVHLWLKLCWRDHHSTIYLFFIFFMCHCHCSGKSSWIEHQMERETFILVSHMKQCSTGEQLPMCVISFATLSPLCRRHPHLASLAAGRHQVTATRSRASISKPLRVLTAGCWLSTSSQVQCLAVMLGGSLSTSDFSRTAQIHLRNIYRFEPLPHPL